MSDLINGEGLHPFLLNTIPKSGTNLLNQILAGMPNISYRPEKFMYMGSPNQIKEHEAVLSGASLNEFLGGHIYYSSAWENMLRRLNMKQVFLSRDPRDIVVSRAYYLNKIPHDPLSQYVEERNLPQKQKYLTLIGELKLPNYYWPNINRYISTFTSWMGSPNVLSVTYEHLVASQSSRNDTIRKIIHFLWEDQVTGGSAEEMISLMNQNVNPQISGTFRKGRMGDWHNEFDEEVKKRFKEVAGELLIDLGYENDLDW